jgi:hypothetical protein
VRRSPLIACIAAVSLAASASTAAASVTIGQLAPSGTALACNIAPAERLQSTVTSGNAYVVPANGTITSWSYNADPGSGQTMAMKIYRKVGDPATFQVVGHDGPRDISGGTLNTFPTNIPVRPGDVLGTYQPTTVPTACGVVSSGDLAYFFTGTLNDGQSQSFNPVAGIRLNVSAVFTPSNTFTLGPVARHKEKGTATLNLTLPNSGELTASGKGVKAASAGPAVVSKAVGAGPAQLLIKATGKKRATLNATGKVKLKVAITYTPTNGDPGTRSVKVKLQKR